MRITVVGASGGIGRALVRQALDAGHEVTAAVRDSPGGAAAITEWEAYAVRPAVAVLDELSADALKDEVAGRDAVASALGPVGRGVGTDVNSRGVRAAAEAMRTVGVRRIVVVGAAPVGPDGGPAVYRRVVVPVLRRVFRAHYADLAEMERVLRGSGLDWTVVRPPKLTNGPATGRLRLVPDGAPRGSTVSRADVATALLRVLDDPATVGHGIGVGH